MALGWPGRRRPPRLGWRRSARWPGRGRFAADCGGCHARWACRSWRGARRRGLALGRAERQEAPGSERLGAELAAVRARVSRRYRPGGAATGRPRSSRSAAPGRPHRPVRCRTGQGRRRARAARMIRSAVRWLTFHSRGEFRRRRLDAGTELGEDTGEPLVSRVRVRLGGGAGSARLVAASHAFAAVGRGPHRRSLPQRDATALGGRAVGVGLGEVAETAVGVDHVTAGVAQHAGGFRRVDQVVRVAAPVDPGQRLDLAALVSPRARRSTRPRTSSPSGRSARPSPDAPSWPGRGTSHRPWSAGRRAPPCRHG